MNQTSTTQQGLIKHGGLHSTTGAHGMRAHNSNKTAGHHVRHSSSGRDSLFYSARELDANLFILKIIDMIRWKSKNLR